MDEFNSETDSDYNSYWRDWVSLLVAFSPRFCSLAGNICWKDGRVGGRYYQRS